MNSNDTKKIVVLGGGFGGVRVALDLSKKLVGSNHEIILISKTDKHDYHADLYEIAGTFLTEAGSKKQRILQYENLEGAVAIDLKVIFQNKNVELLIEEVKDIDLREQFVKLVNGNRVEYDILVFALGSTTNYFSIPHLAERSLPLKTVYDALNIRNQIDELFTRKKRDEDIRIIVGGGGFTGCELAGELPEYLVKLAELHGHNIDNLKLSLFEACPNLLSGAQRWIQEEAKRRLTNLGIELHLESKIINIDPDKVVLESKESIPFDLIVWTAGIKANPLIEKVTGVKLEKNNCLAVDQFLRLISYENVYAVGDNSYCFDYEHNCFVPPTAQLAIAQGKTTAKNITNTINEKPLEKFGPKIPNFIIPIGKGFALGQIFGAHLKGLEAWLLKRIVALKYFLSILSFFTALKIWIKGNQFFTK